MILLFILLVRAAIYGCVVMVYLAFWLMVFAVYAAGVLVICLIALVCLVVDAVRKRQGRKAIERASAAERLAAWNAKLKTMDLREARKRNLA